MPSVVCSPFVVNPPKTTIIIERGLTHAGHRFDVLPCVLRYGYYDMGLLDPERLLGYLSKWLSEKGNGFIRDTKVAIAFAKGLVKSHFEFLKNKKNKKLTKEQGEQCGDLLGLAVSEIIRIFKPAYKIRQKSSEKLETITRNLLHFTYKYGSSGVVSLSKSRMLKMGATEGGNSCLCDYKNILEAFANLNILVWIGNKTWKGGPCKQFKVGDFMKLASDDGFEDRRTKGKQVINSRDKFTSVVSSAEVEVSGDEAIEFAKVFEKKLRQYEDNPFINILPIKRVGNTWTRYVSGAAICKHMQYDITRFVEAQFYYYHTWQDEAPTIRYVTDLMSGWNCMGRYKAYCEKFKGEIGTLYGGTEDNIEEVTARNKVLPVVIKNPVVERETGQQIFNDLMDAGWPREGVYWKQGHPLVLILPIEFLVTQTRWLELLADKFWGEDVNTQFWKTPAGKVVKEHLALE